MTPFDLLTIIVAVNSISIILLGLTLLRYWR